MVDVATMRELDPEQFGQAADGYHAIGSMADGAKRRVTEHVVSAMGKTLEGEAAEAAITAVRGLGKNFHYVQTECGLIRAALNALTAELRAAKKNFDAAEEDARAAHFTVNHDGSVTYPPAGEEVDGKKPEGGTTRGTAKGRPTGNPIDPAADANKLADSLEKQAANANPNPNHGKAVEIADRIADALKLATEADNKWAPKLRALKADDDLHVSRKDWGDVKEDMRLVRKGAGDYLKPPKKGSPEENAAWWKKLSKEERDDYIALHPASVGAMDGLPAEARDEANRTVLAEAKAQYSLQKSAMPPEPEKYVWEDHGKNQALVVSDKWKKWNAKREHLEGALRGMRAIEARFEATGREGLPSAYLLGFSAEGKGRAIIANGNPDTADHTAVYVPGTKSKLEAIGGDIDRMARIWREADTMRPGQDVSTITWLGYDAPQSIVPEATQKGWAEDGAPKLNRYLEGLQTAQGGGDASHTTVVGHSYGSTVVGQASKTGDLAADDIIAVGSPGMLVPNAEDLDVGKGHVWSEAAGADQGIEGFDLVPAGGKVAGLGGWEWKVDTRHGVPIGAEYGQSVPSDEAFGAKRMEVDTSTHSGYWEEGSQSLRNQARVVVGRYGKVKLD
ncbi:alpha/beta hydrolase [Streptomyces sp. RK75]|uniref:alpha/beta hydrolase n=1 Tax=Streptomyces sp. RK75 TaxID=2824895 RepID=UPI0027DC8842|nr:alpha/beta hydrolase [Streptomyces sp. RK75]